MSDRDNHSFIGIYDTRTRRVDFVSPSVDCDAAPAWSADSKRIAFLRRPGVPFGMQAQEGSGGIGNPPGPATGRGGRGAASGCVVSGFGRGGGGGSRGEARPEDVKDRTIERWSELVQVRVDARVVRVVVPDDRA